MKRTAFLNLLVIALALAVSTVGCKRPQKITPIPGARVQAPGPGDGQAQGNFNPQPVPVDRNPVNAANVDPSTQQPGGGDMANQNIDDLTGRPVDFTILKADTVYFDFDSSVVKRSELSKVQAVADYLKSNPANDVLVCGHCDERGTEEYNRSLGERRALAVRQKLSGMGINASRVYTRSYGEDMPADPGHTAAAWDKNRRDEFGVLLPKR